MDIEDIRRSELVFLSVVFQTERTLRTSDKIAIFEWARLLAKGDIGDISRSEFSNLVFLSVVFKMERTLRTSKEGKLVLFPWSPKLRGH